jgi:hypothetical protein
MVCAAALHLVEDGRERRECPAHVEPRDQLHLNQAERRQGAPGGRLEPIARQQREQLVLGGEPGLTHQLCEQRQHQRGICAARSVAHREARGRPRGWTHCNDPRGGRRPGLGAFVGVVVPVLGRSEVVGVADAIELVQRSAGSGPVLRAGASSGTSQALLGEPAQSLDHARPRAPGLLAVVRQLPAQHGQRADAEPARESSPAERASERANFPMVHGERGAAYTGWRRPGSGSSTSRSRSARSCR